MSLGEDKKFGISSFVAAASGRMQSVEFGRFCLFVLIVQETVLIWGAVKHRDTVNHGAMLHPQYTAGWIFHQ